MPSWKVEDEAVGFDGQDVSVAGPLNAALTTHDEYLRHRRALIGQSNHEAIVTECAPAYRREPSTPFTMECLCGTKWHTTFFTREYMTAEFERHVEQERLAAEEVIVEDFNEIWLTKRVADIKAKFIET